MVPHIRTVDGITVVLFNKPYNVAASDVSYNDVVQAVNAGEGEQYILDIVEGPAKKIKAVTSLTYNMEYSGGVVLYNGEVLANYAVNKLIDLLEAGLDHTPLTLFIDNLMQNPSKRVVDDLYRFLEKGRMPITEDGFFLAYKKVREDYKDIHSAKFVNSVGTWHEMPRNQVDEDASRTCSVGFHVCSYDYLPQFAGGKGERVVVCKVNPADVVAIPADYNDTKMRVYRYEVIDEVTDYFKAGDNVLSKKIVAEKPFVVLYEVDGGLQTEEHDRFWTLQEATKEAESLSGDADIDQVWVEDVKSGESLYTA